MFAPARIFSVRWDSEGLLSGWQRLPQLIWSASSSGPVDVCSEELFNTRLPSCEASCDSWQLGARCPLVWTVRLICPGSTDSKSFPAPCPGKLFKLSLRKLIKPHP